MKLYVEGWAQWVYKFGSDNLSWERSQKKKKNLLTSCLWEDWKTVNKVSENQYRKLSNKKEQNIIRFSYSTLKIVVLPWENTDDSTSNNLFLSFVKFRD